MAAPSVTAVRGSTVVWLAVVVTPVPVMSTKVSEGTPGALVATGRVSTVPARLAVNV